MNTPVPSDSHSIHLARGGDEIRTCQVLRHRVYCAELGYEPINPDGLEADDEDLRSEHVLARQLPSGNPVGCVRVIRPAAGRSLPCFAHAQLDAAHAWLEASPLCEFSRLAVLAEARGDSRPEMAHCSLPYRLILACFTIHLHSQHENFIFLTTPAVARMCERIGMGVRPSGPMATFRGHRRLYSGSRAAFAQMAPPVARTVLDLYAQFYPGEPFPQPSLPEARPA